jgi:hypothetical protein
MQTEINEIENMAHDIEQRISEIESVYRYNKALISDALELAELLLRKPEISMNEIESVAGRIVSKLRECV